MKNLADFQPVSDNALYVGPGNSLIQTFISHSSNITGIRLRPYNPRLGGNQTYRVNILDGNNNQIRNFEIKESNVSWGALLRIEFPPIENTYGKKYSIQIVFKDQKPQDQTIITALNSNRLTNQRLLYTTEEIDTAQKSYISFAYSNNDVTGGDFYLNNQRQSGDLEYYIYEQTTPRDFLLTTFKNLSNKIKADPYFFIPYFILLCLLLILMFKSFIRTLHKP